MNIGETVTVVYTDDSGMAVCEIVAQTDTHLILSDGKTRYVKHEGNMYWHVHKKHVKLNSDGVLRTTSNNVFLQIGKTGY